MKPTGKNHKSLALLCLALCALLCLAPRAFAAEELACFTPCEGLEAVLFGDGELCFTAAEGAHELPDMAEDSTALWRDPALCALVVRVSFAGEGSITRIGDNAFRGCVNLEEICVPASVTALGEDVFAGAEGLCLTADCGSDAREWALKNGFAETEAGETATGPCVVTVHSPAEDEAVAPTCEEPGLTAGSHCVRCGAVLAAQESVPALGHDWTEPSYKWNDAHTRLTARRVCLRDETHGEQETVRAMSNVALWPSCEEMGMTTYRSYNFGNPAFEFQVVTVTDIPATGHDWGEPGYTWSGDHSACTASRVCRNDAGHVETETIAATADITRKASCAEAGETTYAAENFSNPAFADQYLTLPDLPTLPHTWEVSPSTAATEDGNGVRGEVFCAVCGEKKRAARTVSFQKTLRLPAALTELEEEAFAGTRAQQVTLPAGVERIGKRAFADSSKLLLAVLPSSIKEIAPDAFADSDVAVLCPDGSYAADWCDKHGIPHNP